jgi:trans-2,3-dihydro-3-hydroxyanthranilate isomerase
MRFAFRIVNVFAIDDDRFSGNPLCVFEDGRELTDAQMQSIARQMNLSETTFVLPAERGGTVRTRIFTPSFEMPFAGHPTLGTAHVVGAIHGTATVTLELPAGLVEVTSHGASWTLRTAKPPHSRALDASPADVAAMLGLPVDAIAGEPCWVDTGVEQLVIPIAGAAHVRAARPVAESLGRIGSLPSRGGEAMAYLWSREGVVRFFFTKLGAVIEDPATGSACANLGGYLLTHGEPVPVEMTLRQGDAVHRPSRLGLRVDTDRSIYVTGNVIDVASGSFTI